MEGYFFGITAGETLFVMPVFFVRIHMNGRVYSPKLGKFLSPDPVTQAPENGQNYNRYSYVFNNPLKYTDPSGYELEEMTVTGSQPSYDWTGLSSGSTLAGWSFSGTGNTTESGSLERGLALAILNCMNGHYGGSCSAPGMNDKSPDSDGDNTPVPLVSDNLSVPGSSQFLPDPLRCALCGDLPTYDDASSVLMVGEDGYSAPPGWTPGAADTAFAHHVAGWTGVRYLADGVAVASGAAIAAPFLAGSSAAATASFGSATIHYGVNTALDQPVTAPGMITAITIGRLTSPVFGYAGGQAAAASPTVGRAIWAGNGAAFDVGLTFATPN